MVSLKEKYGNWAFITGASSGIGAAYANYLAAEGFNLILCARREERLRKLGDELREKGSPQVKILPLDLAKEESIDEIARFTENIDAAILVNNAGSGKVDHFDRIDRKTGSDMIKLNCLMPYLLNALFVDRMKKRGRGALITVGSTVGGLPAPYYTLYSATKAFDNQLGEGLWYELRKYHIDSIAVLPGGTYTEFQEKAGTTQKSFYRQPEDVVHSTFKALGKKPRVVDGFRNKILLAAAGWIPRKLLVIGAGRFVKKNEKMKG